MRHLFLLPLLTLLAISCRKDDPIEAPPSGPVLRIRIVPEWEGQPFQPFTEYRAPGNIRFQAEMVRFYLSDIRAVSATGEQPLSAVKLLKIGSGSSRIDLFAPEGTWLGLRAGLGLPDALNSTNAALYGDEHPMSVNTGMYWSWASGYKFVLFDGRFDPDPLGTGPLLSPFSVHTGMDTCYTTVELFPPLPFSTRMGEVTELTLRVKVDGFLRTPEETIDVVTENSAHGANFPLALKLTRNVKRSLVLE
jgi:hypothetical protein